MDQLHNHLLLKLYGRYQEATGPWRAIPVVHAEGPL